MSQTELILWIVFGASIIALVGIQIRSMIAAARIGGKSSRATIGIRIAMTVVLLGLFGYVVYVQATR